MGKKRNKYVRMTKAMADWYDDIEAEYDYEFEGWDEDEDDDPGPDGPIGADGTGPKDVTLGDADTISAKEAARRSEAFDTINAALTKAFPPGATAQDIVPGASEAEMADVISAANDLRARLGGRPEDPLPLDLLFAHKSAFEEITAALAPIRSEAAAREAARARVRDAFGKIALPDHHSSDEKIAFGYLQGAVQGCLDDPVFDTTTAAAAITALIEHQKALTTAIAARIELHRALTERYEKIVEPDYLKLQEAQGAKLRAAIDAALKAPVTDDANDATEKAIAAFEAWIKTAAAQIEDLGGKADAEKLCSDLGLDMDGLEDWISFAGTGKALAASVKAAGGAKNLLALRTSAGLTATEITEVTTGLGPAFVKELMGGAAKTDTIVALKTEFRGDLGKVATMAKATSLDAKPKALAALLTTGCKGNAVAFKDLITRDFADATDQANLKGMVDAGGLGDAPEVLGALLATGCNGKGTALKSLAKEMSSPDAQAGLAKLLTDGKLSGAASVPPKTLSTLLHHSTNPPPADADMTDAAAKGFAALCTAMKDGKGAENLGNMLTTGGMASDPTVLGPLLSTGCNGDPTKLNALTDGIKGNLPKLEKLLKDGGLGSKDRGDTATGIKPQCLGALFATGCDGKPAEMNKLLGAMNDTDMPRLKALMKDGDLGQYPDALAGLYQQGCLTDPSGATTGEKNPAVLKSMLDAFKDPAQGPKAMKTMLTGAGMGQAGNTHQMGSILRHGCSAPGGTQDASKLLTLGESFNPPPPAKPGRLGTMLTALDATPAELMPTGTDNQPGKGFQNLMRSNRLDGDMSKIESKFLDKLERRDRVPAARRERKLGLADLIRNAASFQGEPMGRGGNTANEDYTDDRGATKRVKIDVGHVAKRHSRVNGNLQNSRASQGKPTTVLPVVYDRARIISAVLGCIQKLVADGDMPKAATDYPMRPARRGQPPTRKDFMSFPRVEDANNPGDFWKIGIKWDSRGNQPVITQFLPKAITGQVKLSPGDFTAIGNAIK